MSDEEFQTLFISEFRSLRQEMQANIASLHQEMQANIASLHQEMQANTTLLRQEISTRFDQVNERFDKVDQRFDQVDERLDSIDKRLSWLENHEEKDVAATLHIIQNKVNEIQEMFQSVSEVLGEHELRIRALRRRTV